MKENNEQTMSAALQIMEIDAAIWERRGIQCRPADDWQYLQLVEEIREEITELPDLPGMITPAVLDILTAHNHHTAAEAAEMVMHDNAW